MNPTPIILFYYYSRISYFRSFGLIFQYQNERSQTMVINVFIGLQLSIYIPII